MPGYIFASGLPTCLSLPVLLAEDLGALCKTVAAAQIASRVIQCHAWQRVLSVGRAQMRGVHVTLRMRLECRIVRQGGQGHAGLEEVYEVLNEVVVDRGANPFLTKIECWERDRLITKARRLLG